jgi:ABC-type Mn2+/Zn2+ transport system ATPase subunit
MDDLRQKGLAREIEGGVTTEPARLELEDVSIVYGQRLALENITFQVPQGERVAVVGPNGAGKSTLFKALVGLIPVSKGVIRVHGKPFRSHEDCVAYIPQREDVDWRFPVTVRDVVMMGRYGRRHSKSSAREDREAVDNRLTQLGLMDLAARSIADLSGGQQQRVFIARALAQDPHILLMDEPFSGVDAATQEATLELLDQLSQVQVTVLVSTHDLELAARRFEHILLLNRTLIGDGDARVVFQPERLRLAFSGHLLVMDGAVLVDDCCAGENPVQGHTHAHSHSSGGNHHD